MQPLPTVRKILTWNGDKIFLSCYSINQGSIRDKAVLHRVIGLLFSVVINSNWIRPIITKTSFLFYSRIEKSFAAPYSRHWESIVYSIDENLPWSSKLMPAIPWSLLSWTRWTEQLLFWGLFQREHKHMAIEKKACAVIKKVLELWRMWTTASLPLLPGSLWLWVVSPFIRKTFYHCYRLASHQGWLVEFYGISTSLFTY